MGGDLVLNIDNAEKPMEGGSICSILTQSSFRGRLLGQSQMLTLPTDILIMANGNNLVLKGDISSRALIVKMDSGTERPELRRFDVDLRVLSRAERPKLLVACLTILRAHHISGRPGMDLSTWGRFEVWSAWVRAALVWLGEPDPLETTEELAQRDPIRENLRIIMSAWIVRFGQMPISLNFAIREAVEIDPVLREAFEEVAGDRSGRISPRILSWFFRRHNDRVVDGMLLKKEEAKSTQAVRWMVVDNCHAHKELPQQKQFHVEQKIEHEQPETDTVQPEQPQQEYMDESETPF